MRVPAGGEGQAAASEEREGGAPEAGSLKGSPQDSRRGAQPSPREACRGAPQGAPRWHPGRGDPQGLGCRL